MTCPYRAALALVDDLAAEGVGLDVTAEGFSPTADPSDALDARLRAFCGEGEGRQGRERNRALSAVLRGRSRGARELLQLPVACAKLPLPYAATFLRGKQVCVFTTSQDIYLRERGRALLFVARELDVAGRAVDLGRAGPAQLDRWLAAKRYGEWVLSPEVADLPRPAPGLPPAPPACSFGQLFDELGAELVEVEIQQGAA